MKKLNILLITLITFFVGIIGVNAQIVDKSVSVIDEGGGSTLPDGVKRLIRRTNTIGSEEKCIYSYDENGKTYYYIVKFICDDPQFFLSNDTNGNDIIKKLDLNSIHTDMHMEACASKVCPILYYKVADFDAYNPDLYPTANLSKNYYCYINNLDNSIVGSHEYRWASESPATNSEVWTLYPQATNEEECARLAGEMDARNNEANETTLSLRSCGKGMLKNIPVRLIKILHTFIMILQVGVPIVLIIFGMIDLAKGVIAQKEDEITKGRKTFITRLITAILIFFVIFIVKIAIRFVNESTESAKIISCVDCFINAKCDY